MPDRTVERLVAEVVAEVDRARVDMARFDEKLDRMARNRRIKVDIDVDKKGEEKFSKLAHQGREIEGLKFASGFISDLLKIPTALSAIGPASAGVLALSGGVVGLTRAIQPLLALSGAAPGILSTFFQGLGAGKLALSGSEEAFKAYSDIINTEGPPSADQLEKLKKSTKGLTDETLKFVQGGSLLSKWFTGDLRPAITNSMLPQLSGLLFGAAANSNTLKKELTGTGAIIGNTGKQLGIWMANPLFQNDFKTIMQGNNRLFGDMAYGGTKLAASLVDIMVAAQPLQRWLGDHIREWADDFAKFISEGRKTGELSASFMDAGRTADHLFSILGNVRKALHGLLGDSDEMAKGILPSLDKLTAKWATWTNANSGSLQKDFKGYNEILKETIGLGGDLIKVLFSNAGKGQSDLLSLIHTLRSEGVPAIKELVDSARDSGVWDALVKAIVPVIEIVGRFAGPSGVLTLGVRTMTGLITTGMDLLDLLGPLGDGFVTFIGSASLLTKLGVGGPIGTALSIFLGLLDTLGVDVKSLTPLIVALGAAFGVLKVASAISQMGDFQTMAQKVIWSIAGGGGGGGAGGGGAGGGLVGSLMTLNPYVIGAAVAIGGGMAMWQAWKKNVDQVNDEIKDVSNSVLKLNKDVLPTLRSELIHVLDTRDSFKESFDSMGISADRMIGIINKSPGDFDKFRKAFIAMGESPYELRRNMDQIPPSLRAVVKEALAVNKVTGDDNAFREWIDAATDTDKTAKGLAAGIRESTKALYEQIPAGEKTGQTLKLYEKAIHKGPIDERRAALQQLVNMYEKEGAAVGLASTREQMLNDTFGKLNNSLDVYMAKLYTQDKSQLDVLGSTHDLNDTYREGAQSILDLVKGGAKHLDVLHGTSEEAGQAYRAFSQMNDATMDLVKAQLKMTGSSDQAKLTLENQRNEFIKLGAALGMNKDQITELLGVYGLLDKDIDIKIKQTGAEDVKTKLEGIQTIIGAQSGKEGRASEKWLANITARWLKGEDPVTLNAEITKWLNQQRSLEIGVKLNQGDINRGIAALTSAFGLIKTNTAVDVTTRTGKPTVDSKTNSAYGGIFEPEGGQLVRHFARGGEWMPRMSFSATNIYNEPSTHGESYIPYAPSVRGQAEYVWKKTGDRLGFDQESGAKVLVTGNTFTSGADIDTLVHKLEFQYAGEP